MPSIGIRLASIAAVVALSLARAAPARATTTNRVTGLVAGARTMFALRANRVVAMDAEGREIARCARFEAPPPERPAATAPGGVVDVDEALRLAGLPDDDPETAEAEEVLGDEGLLPRRRPRADTGEGIVARALAASPADDGVWIATSSGLFRGRDGTCARAALPGRDLVAVASAGESVAAASEELLWRSDGGPFRIAAGMTARPRVLAVVDGEHTLVAGDDGVIEIGPYGAVRPVLDQASDALAVCGGVALAFAGDDVWTWTGDAPPRRAGDRPAARTVVCGDGRAARFVAAGGGVYSSADGAIWREWNAAPGRSVTAAAAITDLIWIAVDDGVVPLRDLAATGQEPRPATSALLALPALPPLAMGRLEMPPVPWPRVMLVFAGHRSALRDAWSLVVLVAFPLGRSRASGAERRQLAAELLRRDAELAAQEAALSLPDTDDPSGAARLRAIRQEREALR